jgi:hypothetical protein
MADLTTELIAHLKALRNTEAGANPGGLIDTTTLLAEDIPAKRTAAEAHVQKDINTVYEKAL